MTNQCIYDNQKECVEDECYNKNCSFSAFGKLRCDECGQIIDDHYYEFDGKCYCEDCLENFKKYTDY